ncbi:uncharacterized protein LOC101453748 [Ceratitis capitata]|uniref:uncharacterized protein LOC101453748 n=1 Tax=Ceratitis capitata TaxID=7213 RepID=UPI0003297F0C|nr:uncharacterized protein LOC101453748 [Ceratitis capitata]
MALFNIEMRLLNLILVWLVCTSQAAPIAEENAINAADSVSTWSPIMQVSLPNTDTNTETYSNLQTADKPDAIFAEAGNKVDEESVESAATAAEHMATAIVAPLTHIAHITYDSVPVTHKPNDRKPLFHRESHDELIKL